MRRGGDVAGGRRGGDRLSNEELERVRRVLRAFPDDASLNEAAELLQTYRAFGRVGNVVLAALKIMAVVSAGVAAVIYLRSLGGATAPPK